jgi:DNA polymerase III subunit beta
VKFTAAAAALASAMSLAGAAVRGGKKDATVHMVADDDGTVKCSCTGSAITITTLIAADVIEPGQIAAATDRLAGLAAGFSPTAELAISAGAGFATITSGNSKSRLPLIPVDDLPDALVIDLETGRVEIAGKDLLTLLEPLAAADSDTTRFYLCGVFLHSTDNKLVACATDGAKLIRTSVAAGPLSEAGLILPRETGAILSRIVRAAKPAKLSLISSRNLVAAHWPGFSFVSRLIDAKYPDYSRVIPPSSSASVTCNRADLIAALTRLGAVAAADPLLALSFDHAPRLNVLLARQPGDARDAVAAETVGEGRVVVPLGQLVAMLSEFEGARIRLDVGDGQRPVLIHGDNGKLALLTACRWIFSSNEKREAAMV